MAYELDDSEIVGRVKLANLWLRPFRQSDLVASNAYIDANDNSATMNGSDDGWDEVIPPRFQQTADYPEVVPIGQPNYMAINTEVSSAAICSQTPKLHIRANEDKNEGFPGAPAIIQEAWQQVWRNGSFKHKMRGAWQKRKICGLGCIWYRWDENFGFSIENVTSNRFFFDPHTTDLRRMRYAGVAVNMPLSEAVRKYDPDKEHGYFADEDADTIDTAIAKTRRRLSFGEEDEGDGVGGSGERVICRIFIYFDNESEVHVYEDRVIHRSENLLGRIPLLFRAMFIDPRDRILPLGMNVYARGLNQELVWLTGIVSSTAKHGGAITLFDTNMIKGQARTALETGSASQMIGVERPINEKAPPIMRVPGEPLSPAYGPAQANAQAALDGIMGASPSMRGESTPGVTATAAMLSESRSNAMMVDERMEFEDWCTDVATAFVMCTQRFGGPEEGKKVPAQAVQLWHAFLAVHSVKVVNGSTSFSNPATELTSSMQLYTTIIQSWELWTQLAAKGLITQVPNLQAVFNDLLIAANRTDTDQYWKPAPPPPQGAAVLPPDLVKWMQTNYLDSPPDIQRQMEQMLGFQPSQVGTQQEQQKPDHGLESVMAELQMHREKIAAKEKEQESEHAHDYRMKALDTAAQVAVQSHRAATTPENTTGNGAAGRKKPKT